LEVRQPAFAAIYYLPRAARNGEGGLRSRTHLRLTIIELRTDGYATVEM